MLDVKEPLVIVFADSANLHNNAREIYNGHFNYVALLKLCATFGKVVEKYAYVPNDGFGQNLITSLGVKGFDVVCKDVEVFNNTKPNGDGQTRKTGNFDVEIAVDMMVQYKNYDVICLASSDGDFVYLIKMIRRLEIEERRKNPRIFHILGFKPSAKFSRLNDANVVVTQLNSNFVLDVPGKGLIAKRH
jgi:uncharacterized LabA/DUF88 family protein